MSIFRGVEGLTPFMTRGYDPTGIPVPVPVDFGLVPVPVPVDLTGTAIFS